MQTEKEADFHIVSLPYHRKCKLIYNYYNLYNILHHYTCLKWHCILSHLYYLIVYTTVRSLQTVANAFLKSTKAQNNFFFLLFKISRNGNNVKILSVVEYDFLSPNWFSSNKILLLRTPVVFHLK